MSEPYIPKTHTTLIPLDVPNDDDAETAIFLHDAANKLTAIVPNLELLSIASLRNESQIRQIRVEMEQFCGMLKLRGIEVAEKKKILLELRGKIDETLQLLDADSDTIRSEKLACMCYEEICAAASEFERLVDFIHSSEKVPRSLEPLTETEMAGYVSSIVNHFQRRFPRISFHMELNPHVKANIFPDAFKRALENLILNAVQAILDSGGDVHIRLKEVLYKAGEEELPGVCEGSYCRLEIEDNGIGISPCVLGCLAKSKMSTKAGGSGLGLKSVRRSIKMHQGYLMIESEEGKFTRVSTLVPSIPPMSSPVSMEHDVSDESVELKVS